MSIKQIGAMNFKQTSAIFDLHNKRAEAKNQKVKSNINKYGKHAKPMWDILKVD